MADSSPHPVKCRPWWKRGVRWLVALGILYMLLRWFEHSQVYHPSRELEASPALLRRAFEEIRFVANDGVKLHGWYFPANTNSPRAPFAFLICHGNGGNVSHRLGLSAALLETGASVFVFDYRGYGESEGKPSEEGTYRDAQAAYAWLKQKGFRGENIIALGESLGGGVVSELALRETVGGVILQSTFSSIPDIGAEFYPWLPVRWLSTIKYDTCAKLPRITVPVLVMHSRTDDLVNYKHAERNFAAAREPKFFCELRGGHNQSMSELKEFSVGIEKFLRVVEEKSARAAK